MKKDDKKKKKEFKKVIKIINKINKKIINSIKKIKNQNKKANRNVNLLRNNARDKHELDAIRSQIKQQNNKLNVLIAKLKKSNDVLKNSKKTTYKIYSKNVLWSTKGRDISSSNGKNVGTNDKESYFKAKSLKECADKCKNLKNCKGFTIQELKKCNPRQHCLNKCSTTGKKWCYLNKESEGKCRVDGNKGKKYSTKHGSPYSYEPCEAIDNPKIKSDVECWFKNTGYLNKLMDLNPKYDFVEMNDINKSKLKEILSNIKSINVNIRRQESLIRNLENRKRYINMRQMRNNQMRINNTYSNMGRRRRPGWGFNMFQNMGRGGRGGFLRR
jgi:hypothetical protein